MILKSREKQVRIVKMQGEQRCPAGLRLLRQNPEQRGEAAHLVLILGVHSPGQRLWGLLLGTLDLGLAPSSPWSPRTLTHVFWGPALPISRVPLPRKHLTPLGLHRPQAHNFENHRCTPQCFAPYNSSCRLQVPLTSLKNESC